MPFYSGVSLARERPADYFTGRENRRVFSAELTASPNSTKCFVFVNPKTKSCLQETKTAFHTACRLAGIEGLIWKDLRATFGPRLAEAGCDACTMAQLS